MSSGRRRGIESARVTPDGTTAYSRAGKKILRRTGNRHDDRRFILLYCYFSILVIFLCFYFFGRLVFFFFIYFLLNHDAWDRSVKHRDPGKYVLDFNNAINAYINMCIALTNRFRTRRYYDKMAAHNVPVYSGPSGLGHTDLDNFLT